MAPQEFDYPLGVLVKDELAAVDNHELPPAAVGLPTEEVGQDDEPPRGRPRRHPEDLDRWAAMYSGERDPGSPLISPLFADLAGLPPLLVEVGTSEVLLDDARRLAERARAAGVEVTLTMAEDMIHVWHFFAGSVPEADDGVRRVAEFITRHTG